RDALVRCRKLTRKSGAEGLGLALRLLERDARLQPGHGAEDPEGAISRLLRRRPIDRTQRRPQLEFCRWESERGWRNADDDVARAAHVHAAAEHTGIAAETRLPEGVAENQRVLAIVVFREVA